MENTTREITSALRASTALVEALTSLSEATSKLAEKRATLEEKMLSRYFHTLASDLASAHAILNQVLAEKSKSEEEPVYSNVIALSNEVVAKLAEFHKAIDYNWNYLEQYFEHGYLAQLNEDMHFLENAQKTLTELKKIQST